MKKFIVWFEIGGKKLKMKVTAPTKEFAKEAVKAKIVFHKIEDEEKYSLDQMERMFNQIFK